MVAQRQMVTLWQGRLEGLLARHWPEASQVLKLSSGTLLRILKRYGSPQALALDAEAAKQLARWGRSLLSPEKIEEVFAWVNGNSVRSRNMPRRHSPPGSNRIERNGGWVSWLRDMRSSRRKERWS